MLFVKDATYFVVFRPSGKLVINHGRRGAHGTIDIVDLLSPNHRSPSVDGIEKELIEEGFQLVKSFEYSYVQDFRNPDNGFVEFFSSDVNRKLSADELRSAVMKIWPDEQGETISQIIVFKRS